MASTRLTKTFSSSGNRNKWTISLWVKRGKLGSTQTLFACHQNSNYKTRLEIGQITLSDFGPVAQTLL